MSDIKTYDIIIRVSATSGRKESGESTMTPEDQSARRREVTERWRGGTVGKIHRAKEVSGWASVESAAFNGRSIGCRPAKPLALSSPMPTGSSATSASSGPIWTNANGELTGKALPARHGKVLVPDPETASIVRRIFELRHDGHSWTDIAERLEADGIPTPTGGGTRAFMDQDGEETLVQFSEFWTHSTLRGICRNETSGALCSTSAATAAEASRPVRHGGMTRPMSRW